jgi:thiaminase
MLEFLLEEELALWTNATSSHDFIVACTAGSISEHAFNTWLAQDYRYGTSL